VSRVNRTSYDDGRRTPASCGSSIAFKAVETKRREGALPTRRSKHMRDWKGSRRAAAVALTLALITLGATRDADAHPRGRVVVHGGFYGWGPWYGFGLGWGPYW